MTRLVLEESRRGLRIDFGYAADNTGLLFPYPQLTSIGLVHRARRVRRGVRAPLAAQLPQVLVSREAVPHTVLVADRFQVVALANDTLTQVRQRDRPDHFRTAPRLPT